MSRMMDDLNRLSESRNEQNDIVVEETPKVSNVEVSQPRDREIKLTKIYAIAFLTIILIAVSTFSLALGLRNASQLVEVEIVSEGLRQALDAGEGNVLALESLMTDQGLERSAQILHAKHTVEELTISVKEGKTALAQGKIALAKMTAGYKADDNALRNSMKKTTDDLKVADTFMQD